ncbi:hypothetical protein GCM10027342_08940 [Photobacterium alginatilyticum]
MLYLVFAIEARPSVNEGSLAAFTAITLAIAAIAKSMIEVAVGQHGKPEVFTVRVAAGGQAAAL